MQARREHVLPGGVIGVVTETGRRTVVAVGRHTYDPSSPVVTAETIYDVASVTKVLPTSMLALQLAEQRKLNLDAPISTVLPEFVDPTNGGAKIRHLISQTLGWTGHLAHLVPKGIDAVRRHILNPTFRFAPGSQPGYANASSILLGWAIERVTGSTLDVLAQQHFFEPLNLSRTSFTPQRIVDGRDIPPTEVLNTSKGPHVIQGIVHDESARLLSTASGHPVGSAGLFSTVPDLLTFLEMILHEGSLKGRHYFTNDTIKLMRTNQVPDAAGSIGVGWELNERRYVGHYAHPGTISKSGFTGCLVAVDPTAGRAWAMLSNHTYPTRAQSRDKMNELRVAVSDAVLQA